MNSFNYNILDPDPVKFFLSFSFCSQQEGGVMDGVGGCVWWGYAIKMVGIYIC